MTTTLTSSACWQDRLRVSGILLGISLTIAALAAANVKFLSWSGVTLLSVRAFKGAKERMDMTMAALKCLHLAARPDLWQPFAAVIKDVFNVAKPVTLLKTRFPKQSADIHQVLHKASNSPQTRLYVPMVGRKSFWTVFIDPTTAEVLATIPLDSF